MVDRTIAHDEQTTSGNVTFEEYLRWPDERRTELVDGRIEYLVPISLQHQQVLGFLYILLAAFLAKRPLGTVTIAQFPMKLFGKPHGREPDLLFVSTAHYDRLHATYLDGPADLVIEIISPESIERDTIDKFKEYEAAGVPEYVLIDLEKREVQLNRLGSDHKYHVVPIAADGAMHFEVIPGFKLAVALIWQDPLPTVQQTVELVEAMLQTGM